MADKRQRAYYTKAQITTGLLTEGGQYMLVDNTEYKGQYHTYTTGEVFTEPSYVNGLSKKLIPFVDIQSTNLEIDNAKNFEYDSIKKITVNKSMSPNPAFVPPTNKDILRGYMIRNFAVKVNDGDVFEITREDISNIGSENGLDINLYRTFNLRWKITGPTDDILDSKGNIVEAGIAPTNQRTINIKSEQYPNLKTYLTNLIEFSTGQSSPTTPTTSTTPSTTPSTGTTSGGSTSVGGGGTSTSGGGY